MWAIVERPLCSAYLLEIAETVTAKVEQIRQLLKSIETGDPKPVLVVNEAKYIQHNPQTHEGSEGLATLFARLAKTQPRVEMIRGFADGDYVFAHMAYDFSSPKVCFEVFRFEDGFAVEHWDNLQEQAAPNHSNRTMLDGEQTLDDLPATEANRARVRAFVEVVLLDKQIDRIEEFVDVSGFAEHNPRLSDDLTQLKTELVPVGASQPKIDYRVLHRVLAQGNFVLSMSEGYVEGALSAFYDLYRLQGGLIVEHWDTTEQIAPTSQWKNNNGKF